MLFLCLILLTMFLSSFFCLPCSKKKTRDLGGLVWVLLFLPFGRLGRPFPNVPVLMIPPPVQVSFSIRLAISLWRGECMPLTPSTSHPSSTNRRHYLTPCLNTCCFGVVVMFDTTALCFFLCFFLCLKALTMFFVIVFLFALFRSCYH